MPELKKLFFNHIDIVENRLNIGIDGIMLDRTVTVKPAAALPDLIYSIKIIHRDLPP